MESTISSNNHRKKWMEFYNTIKGAQRPEEQCSQKNKIGKLGFILTHQNNNSLKPENSCNLTSVSKNPNALLSLRSASSASSAKSNKMSLSYILNPEKR